MRRPSIRRFILWTIILVVIFLSTRVLWHIKSRELPLHIPVSKESIGHIPTIDNPAIEETYYTIFDASGFSESLNFLDVKQDGWRVLVVNLNDASKRSTCEYCHYLDDHWVDTNIRDKWSSHINKFEFDPNGLNLLAGTIFALSQKASWIYVTDRPVPIPYKTFKRATKPELNTGLVYHGPNTVFEPCDHFMDPFTWNGLRVQSIGGRYNIKPVSYDSLYYVLNECFREGMSQQKWQNALDTKAPIPYTMPGTFATIGFKNVLVSRPNAWALIASALPVDKDNSKLWSESLQINLMVQRILWETPSNVGFLPDEHNIGQTCPTCDLQARLDKSGKDLLDKLTQWRCENSQSVPNCLKKLSTEDMIPNKNVEHLLSSWFSLLDSIGWICNKRHQLNDNRLKKNAGIPVHFTPAKSLQKLPVEDTRPPNAYAETCRQGKEPYVSKIPDKRKHIFEDIVLVIVFNFGTHLDLIPLIEYSYGRHFKHMIYCSDNIEVFKKDFGDHFNVNPVSFIERPHRLGKAGQLCISGAIQMGYYDVKGYLQASDDIPLNLWNFARLSQERPWFQFKMRVGDLNKHSTPDVWIFHGWKPWEVPHGRPAALNSINHLKKIISDPTHGEMISKFLKNLSQSTKCDHCVVYEASDVFFVPRHLTADFSFLAEIFGQHGTHFEIVVATILVGLATETEIYRLRGNYLWYEDRVRVAFAWSEFDHFIHPFKMSVLKGDSAKFYCNYLFKIDNFL